MKKDRPTDRVWATSSSASSVQAAIHSELPPSGWKRVIELRLGRPKSISPQVGRGILDVRGPEWPGLESKLPHPRRLSAKAMRRRGERTRDSDRALPQNSTALPDLQRPPPATKGKRVRLADSRFFCRNEFAAVAANRRSPKTPVITPRLWEG